MYAITVGIVDIISVIVDLNSEKAWFIEVIIERNHWGAWRFIEVIRARFVLIEGKIWRKIEKNDSIAWPE